jgi:hypothetical protein
MLNSKSLPILAGAAALGAFVAAVPAHASLTDEGITYTLFETSVSGNTADFDLNMTGITTSSPGGRTGINGIAFGKDNINFTSAAFISATGLTGTFTEMAGGLNSGGCDGSSNAQFCFAANTANLSPANTNTADFDFSVTVSSGGFAGFADEFKIDWIGSQPNYDLVSKALPAVPVPAPLIGHGLLVLLAVGGVLFGGKLFESLKMRRSLAT